jgi:uncharacterized damage-inducible protein DinB
MSVSPYLVGALAANPPLVAQFFGQVQTRLDAPTGPDRFTPREVLAHLVDWEPIFRGRMQQAFERPNSSLTAYDESARAQEFQYGTWDAETTLSRFLAERETTVAWLRSLSPEDWARAARHPERGTMSIADIAHYLLTHDLYHISQLRQFAESS